MTAQQRRVKVVPAAVADCHYEVVYDDYGALTLLGRFPVLSAARGYQRYVRGLAGAGRALRYLVRREAAHGKAPPGPPAER